MPKGLRLADWLVRRRGMTKREAVQLIAGGAILFNGKQAAPNLRVEAGDEIRMNGEILKAAEKFSYVLFYKPRGIECTLNPSIDQHLGTVFHFPKKLVPVGRLDKDSEGLLLMTDDGALVLKLAGGDKMKEKEYEVDVDKIITDEFLEAMRSGIVIMGKKTRPAVVTKISEQSFRIILTQGMNRQIRRMCYKQHIGVTRLKRIRIHTLTIGNLEPGRWREISDEEREILLKSVR